MLRVLRLLVVTGALVALVQPAAGGVVTPPLAVDAFDSRGDFELELLPAWTGLPAPLPVSFQGFGPTTIFRELTAFGAPDTVDTEIISMELTGTAIGAPVVVRAGAGNGIFPGLPAAMGQLREATGVPPDGAIDVFPLSIGDSIFDVFVELWVDLSMDGTADVGEVLRSVNAIRMANVQELIELPPPVGDKYAGMDLVQPTDPLLGEFGATLIPGPLELFVVMADGSLDLAAGPHARVSNEIHTVVPEPASGLAWSLLCLGGCVLAWRRRRRAG